MALHQLFQCPRTGLTVQARFEADLANDDRREYRQTDCLACGQSHFINVKTGKLLGEE